MKGESWTTQAWIVMSLLSIASHTPPRSTSSSMKSSPTVQCSALSPRPVAFKTQAFSEADEAFFRMFQAFTGDRGISFVSDGADFIDLSAVMTRLRPGGVMFVEMQNHRGWWNYLRGSGYEYFPMMWRTYHVWRKPMRGVGASA
jgi:hypothetical protein